MRLSLQNLRCEHQENPIGIDIKNPSLSWEIVAEKRGTMQSAYQVVVSEGEAAAGKPDNVIWDSGKVVSDNSVAVVYGGPPLQSKCRYNWKARVWDERGEASEWSRAAFWEMGLLSTSDWIAKWIEPQQQPAIKEIFAAGPSEGHVEESDGLPYEQRLRPCPMLRKTFHVGPGVKRARAYATAHGLYHMEINGVKAGDREFTPEFTSYSKLLMYQTYDITSLIHTEDNALGVILGDGWYVGRLGLFSASCQFGDKLGLLLQLDIEYDDGMVQTVASDGSFLCSTGPYVFSDLFIGEKYNAANEQLGWSTAGFDDSDWTSSAEAEYSLENLTAQYGEPVRTIEEIVPSTIIMTPKGEIVIDLGQNIAGRMRMRFEGSAGDIVTMEHSEVLDENGNFFNNIMGAAKDQKDIYIARGGGIEVYEPRFSFHGFRYVKVTGWRGELSVDDFRGIVIGSDLRRTGSFKCSDSKINRLQDNIFWSQRTNMLSIPTDCPQREKMGFTGDIQVFVPTACFNMDVQAFLIRWLRSVKADQSYDGRIPVIVPNLPSYEKFGTSAGWGDACIIVPWVLYCRYGDARVLEENYETMARWVEYIKKVAEDNLPEGVRSENLSPADRERQKYLWNTGFHFADWLIPSLSMSRDGEQVDMRQSAYATMELVPTCFYARSTELLSKIAAILGKTADAEKLAELNVKVRSAFAGEYLKPDGSLKAHFQGIYVLALEICMVPNTMRSKVFSKLVDLIRENDGKLDTGFVSVPFLLDVLCDNGRKDLAYDLLFQDKCPSWLYEVNNGATTIWEAWQAVLENGKVTSVSFNHYAFGCVGDWMYRRIGGICRGQPGYKHIVIRPEPDERLTCAEARFWSVYGEIVSAWRIINGIMRMMVRIPPNTTACIVLPGAASSEVTESGLDIGRNDDIRDIRKSEADVLLSVCSGEYLFEYPYS